MSSDNGVYILPIETRYGVTYFVKEMQASENLNWSADRNDGYNSKEVILFLTDATRFVNRGEAVIHAHDLHQKLYMCEYGVNILQPVKLEA